MTKLIDALRTKDTTTENGMVTNSTTLNGCVDLFSTIGSLRGKEKTIKLNLFAVAFAEDPLTAMKILFWGRDIRGGAGERETFRQIIKHLANTHVDVLRKNLALIPEYGRWDDLFVLVGTELQSDALDIIVSALNDGNCLAAKWCPRGNTKNRDRKRWAKALRNHMNLSPNAYRKTLVELSNTVEQLMCAKEFDKITYSHVPSKAMSDYMSAFKRNDETRFNEFLGSVEKGEVKINTGAIYPYDVIKSLRKGNSRGSDVQWNSLPNFLEDSKERVLPVVDVSSSMYWPEARISGDLFAGDVAQSLGLYVSQRNEGPFKDAIMSFHTTPKLTVVKGNLYERYKQLNYIGVGGSTNLEATFKVILEKAKEFNVPADEMPTMVLIFSDMQFNECVKSPNATAQEMIEEMYKESGYEVPKIVFWQLNARGENQPVQYDKSGVALVSGFSPAIMSDLLGGKDLSPYSLMMEVINKERYSPIRV